MAEEFQAAICGDNNWWNINNYSTRSMFPLMMIGSTCSVAANNNNNDAAAAAGNYSTWQTDFMDLKATTTRSYASEADTHNNNNFVSNGSFTFLDAQNKPQHQQSDQSGTASGGTTDGSILIDSTLQIMGFALSSAPSSSIWNNNSHSLFGCNGRPENNFHSVLEEETGIDSCNNNNSQIHSSSNSGQVSTVDAFKPMNQEDQFPIDEQSLNSVTSTTGGGLIPNNIESVSYGYPSTLMQGLYEPNPQQQPQPQNNSLFTNACMSYSSAATTNYGTCSSSELSPTWSTVSSLMRPSPSPSPSSSMAPNQQQQQQQLSGLHFSNNTPFWNASAEALNDIKAGVFSSSTSQQQYPTPILDDKPNCSIAPLNKLKREESPEKASSTANKSGSEAAAFKRPRIETPSPLPTFKVRKEKLGDRITALQQLVSPFGKTDTASVLHEAIEYIKFLHDQVNVLSTPYMKNGAPIQHQQGCENVKDADVEGGKQDLRSRGLCLVPISSTLFPMATETTADFWTPTFGGALIGR